MKQLYKISNIYKKYVKRFFDFVSALALFIIIIPVFSLISILVRVRLGSPVFFRQERTGMNGRKFRIIKFRTMTEAKDKDGYYLPDEERITRWGKVLRSTSLDELPELLNIIAGQMSVIGPRPLPPTYDPYYTEQEKKRFTVRGGLIPPEVLYRDVEPTWEKQFEYEVHYAENASLLLDVRIFFRVVKGLCKRYKNNYGNYVRASLIDSRKSTVTSEGCVIK